MYLQGAEQVTHFCRLLHQPSPGGGGITPRGGEQTTSGKPLSESQRLQKVIRELLTTERQYVKVGFLFFKLDFFVKHCHPGCHPFAKDSVSGTISRTYQLLVIVAQF